MKKVLLIVFVLMGLTLNAQKTEVTITDINGKVIEKGYYNELNQRDSIWYGYNDEGKLILESQYENGVKTGIWRMYNEKGRVIFKIVYVDGKMRRGKQWDDKGHLIDSRTWDAEEILVAEYKRYYH